MARYLVIVESPAKVKTIKKFLGSNYVVMASNGHVRDLPKSQLGIDIEHDYEPKYITIRGKGEILAALRKEVKKADKVYLATDPDREGEAISWHLSQALKLEKKKTYRISFNEITKTAVKASLKNAREIDTDLVDAQQARRVLDRIVGYKISPLLWAKVKRGLSAGRVQSVALRIIADREDEINAFIPEEFWTLDANLKVAGEKKLLKAKFYGKGNQKLTIRSKEELDQIIETVGLPDPNVWAHHWDEATGGREALDRELSKIRQQGFAEAEHYSQGFPFHIYARPVIRNRKFLGAVGASHPGGVSPEAWRRFTGAITLLAETLSRSNPRTKITG